MKKEGTARAEPELQIGEITGAEWPEEAPGDPDHCKAAELIGCDECDHMITCCKVWYQRGELPEGSLPESILEEFRREEAGIE